MARAIDAVQVLNDINRHHKPNPVSDFESGFNNGLNQAMWIITHAPTLTPPNEPLTLDELLKMDGEPVYVVFMPDSSGERSQSWALVNVDEKYGEVYLVDSIPGASCYYDEIWADLEGIYRRPPEGESNARTHPISELRR